MKDADTPIIRELRDHLLERGRLPRDVRISDLPPSDVTPEEAALLARVAPFAELMILMSLADGEISPEERQAALGAMQTLTGGAVRLGAIRTLRDRIFSLVRDYGREIRLEAACDQLATDRDDAALAFTLAAAMAMADGRLLDSELALLERIAEWLGLDDGRVATLLDSAAGGPGLGRR